MTRLALLLQVSLFPRLLFLPPPFKWLFFLRNARKSVLIAPHLWCLTKIVSGFQISTCKVHRCNVLHSGDLSDKLMFSCFGREQVLCPHFVVAPGILSYEGQLSQELVIFYVYCLVLR